MIKEIISAIADESGLNENYVEELVEKGVPRAYPITIGRSFGYDARLQKNTTRILVAQQRIIKALAQGGDCVVMGQSADVILQEHEPFNLFVYARMSAKIERCLSRAAEGEHLTDKKLMKKIKQIDATRAQNREMLTSLKWGRKESYHLCVNTTGVEIKSLVPHIADYAKFWLGNHRK